jgi:phosphate transport system protein
VAVDLRSILAGLKINTDLERVGDLAVNIAEAAEGYLSDPQETPIVGDIPQMAELSQTMLRDALNSYVSHDTAAAQSVLDRDDALDDLNMKVFRDLLDCMLENAETIAAAVNLILIARHLERVGDHATNIAEDVIFIVAARDVRHLADARAQRSTAMIRLAPGNPRVPMWTRPDVPRANAQDSTS